MGEPVILASPNPLGHSAKVLMVVIGELLQPQLADNRILAGETPLACAMARPCSGWPRRAAARPSSPPSASQPCSPASTSASLTDRQSGFRLNADHPPITGPYCTLSSKSISRNCGQAAAIHPPDEGSRAGPGGAARWPQCRRGSVPVRPSLHPTASPRSTVNETTASFTTWAS